MSFGLLSAKKIIIYQPYGGLGDNLAFSTLPELFNNKGIMCYIHINNSTRNDDEVYDLVWGVNPFIIGKSNDTPNAGSCRLKYWTPARFNKWFIERIEIAHDLKPTSYYPKIYYEPKIILDLSNTIFIDLTGVSQIFHFNKSKEFIDYFVPKIINKNKPIKIVNRKKFINSHFEKVYDYLKLKLNNCEYYTIDSLYMYCDVIKSCYMFITHNTGIQSLAAAIKQDSELPNILCCNQFQTFTEQENKGYYNYKNVEYYNSKISD
jgi:hypothetical protein